MQTTSHIEKPSAMQNDSRIHLINKPPVAHWATIPLQLVVGYGLHGAWLHHIGEGS
jgi:hypothetical protein